MKKILAWQLLSILIISNNAKSQSNFREGLGGSFGDAIIENSRDSTFYVGYDSPGFFTSTADIRITKLNFAGDTLWSKFYGSAVNYQYATKISSMKLTENNGLIISGTVGIVPTKIYVLRIDSAGNKLWSKNYEFSSSFEYSFVYSEQLSDHGFIVSGVAWNGVSVSLSFVFKLSSIGNILFSRVFKFPFDNTYVRKVSEAKNNNLLLMGLVTNLINSNTVHGNPFLLELSPTGNFLWDKFYGDSTVINDGLDFQIIDSTIYLLGIEDLENTTSTYLLKADSSGNILWTKTYYGFFGHSMTLNWDSTFLIAGGGFNAQTITPILSRTNLFGDAISTTDYGVPDGGWGNKVIMTPDSGVILMTFGPYLIKTNISGVTGCNEPIIISIDTMIPASFSQPIQFINLTLNTSNEFNLTGRGSIQITDYSNWCPTVSVTELNNPDELEISPNPTTGKLTIGNSQSPVNEIDLFNLLGEKVPAAVDCKLLTVDCSLLPPGIYILQASGEGKVWRGKVVKE